MHSELRYRINSPNVIHETIDGETVIINLTSGRYYSLERTAAEIWSLMESKATAEEAVRWMSRRYGAAGVDMQQVVAHFLEELRQEDLLRLDEANQPPAGGLGTLPDIAVEDFEMPAMHKYTDMEDLLLLDPIHEVDESGWPVAKPDTSLGQ